ncbi:phosphoesterase PA-phosphatase [Blastococcus sp. TBT05-19]|nr:phosphoesterase PA-phosphatase [Blastococcus sp. TBT05-19]
MREAGISGSPAVVSVGRPPWWLVAVSFLVGALITADLLADGRMLRLDLRVSEIVSDWGLRDADAYPAVWLVTQLGGRVTILVVLAGLVGYLLWRRGAWVPALRVVIAVAVLTAGIYAIKHGTGRTAPAFPGSYFFHDDGASFPSGHVANAVVMWGVARWQAVSYGLPAAVQRTFWWLSILGPVGTGVAMVSLDYHWVTDAVVGAAAGIVLLGVVHALDAFVLSRWVRADAGRPTA